MSCALVTGVQTCALPIFGALAPGDDLAECLRVVANIFDDTALDAHRLPEGSHFIVQPLLGDRNSLVALHHLANAARALPPKLLSSEERRVGKACVSTCRSGWAPCSQN